MKMILKSHGVIFGVTNNIITISSIFARYFCCFRALLSNCLRQNYSTWWVCILVTFKFIKMAIKESIENSFIPDDSLRLSLQNQGNINAYNERLESFALSSEEPTKGVMVMGIQFEKEEELMDLELQMTAGKFPSDTSNALVL